MKRIMDDGPLPNNLSLKVRAPQLGKGLLEELTAWADAAPAPRLVIIDTLSRVMPDSGGANEYAFVTKVLAPLQDFAFERNLAILLIHHARKGGSQESGDPFDLTLGTTAINGAMDSILVLTKDRMQVGKATATIAVTGRDIEERKFNVAFDEQFGRWELAEVNSLDSLPSERLAVLRAVAAGHTSPKAISEQVRKSTTNTQNRLKELVDTGLVIKVKTGLYELSPMARQGLGIPRESSESREGISNNTVPSANYINFSDPGEDVRVSESVIDFSDPDDEPENLEAPRIVF